MEKKQGGRRAALNRAIAPFAVAATIGCGARSGLLPGDLPGKDDSGDVAGTGGKETGGSAGQGIIAEAGAGGRNEAGAGGKGAGGDAGDASGGFASGGRSAGGGMGGTASGGSAGTSAAAGSGGMGTGGAPVVPPLEMGADNYLNTACDNSPNTMIMDGNDYTVEGLTKGIFSLPNGTKYTLTVPNTASAPDYNLTARSGTGIGFVDVSAQGNGVSRDAFDDRWLRMATNKSGVDITPGIHPIAADGYSLLTTASGHACDASGGKIRIKRFERIPGAADSGNNVNLVMNWDMECKTGGTERACVNVSPQAQGGANLPSTPTVPIGSGGAGGGGAADYCAAYPVAPLPDAGNGPRVGTLPNAAWNGVDYNKACFVDASGKPVTENNFQMDGDSTIVSYLPFMPYNVFNPTTGESGSYIKTAPINVPGDNKNGYAWSGIVLEPWADTFDSSKGTREGVNVGPHAVDPHLSSAEGWSVNFSQFNNPAMQPGTYNASISEGCADVEPSGPVVTQTRKGQYQVLEKRTAPNGTDTPTLCDFKAVWTREAYNQPLILAGAGNGGIDTLIKPDKPVGTDMGCINYRSDAPECVTPAKLCSDLQPECAGQLSPPGAGPTGFSGKVKRDMPRLLRRRAENNEEETAMQKSAGNFRGI